MVGAGALWVVAWGSGTGPLGGCSLGEEGICLIWCQVRGKDVAG